VRILDDKGRLFGKINLFDFSVLAFLGLIAPLFYIGQKAYLQAKRSSWSTKGEFTISLDGKFLQVPPETMAIMKVGDKGFDARGRVTAEIISLGKDRLNKYKYDLGVAKFFETDKLRECDGTLSLKVAATEEVIFYNERRVLYETPLTFINPKYTVTFVPTLPLPPPAPLLWDSGTDTYVEIDAVLKDLDSDMVKLVSTGDKELGENGATIAEIVSAGKPQENLHTMLSGSERVVVGVDRSKFQLPVRMRLLCRLSPQRILFFKGSEVKNASLFFFKPGKYAATAEVNNYQLSLPPAPEPQPWETGAAISMEICALLKDLDSNALKLVSVGDKEEDKNGATIAEIVSVGKPQHNLYTMPAGNNEIVLGVDRSRLQIPVRMRLLCRLSTQRDIFFKGSEIKNASFFSFNPGKYAATVKVNSSQPASAAKEAVLRIKVVNVIPQVRSIIKPGDTSKNREGEETGKIIGIVSDGPTAIEAVSRDMDKFIFLKHPYNRDIVIELKLSVSKINDDLFFENLPVKTGLPLTFSTAGYSLSGTIIQVSEL
jgi:hypothetical protein